MAVEDSGSVGRSVCVEGLRGSRSREAQCWGARHRDASIFRRCRTSSRLPPSLRLFSHSRDRWIVDVSLSLRALPRAAVSLFVPLRFFFFRSEFIFSLFFFSASFFFFTLRRVCLYSLHRQFPRALPRTIPATYYGFFFTIQIHRSDPLDRSFLVPVSIWNAPREAFDVTRKRQRASTFASDSARRRGGDASVRRVDQKRIMAPDRAMRPRVP